MPNAYFNKKVPTPTELFFRVFTFGFLYAIGSLSLIARGYWAPHRFYGLRQTLLNNFNESLLKSMRIVVTYPNTTKAPNTPTNAKAQTAPSVNPKALIGWKANTANPSAQKQQSSFFGNLFRNPFSSPKSRPVDIIKDQRVSFSAPLPANVKAIRWAPVASVKQIAEPAKKEEGFFAKTMKSFFAPKQQSVVAKSLEEQTLLLAKQTIDANENQDLYKLLNLDKNTELTASVIKKAYFNLALQIHPDKVANFSKETKNTAAEAFKLIGQFSDKEICQKIAALHDPIAKFNENCADKDFRSAFGLSDAQALPAANALNGILNNGIVAALEKYRIESPFCDVASIKLAHENIETINREMSDYFRAVKNPIRANFIREQKAQNASPEAVLIQVIKAGSYNSAQVADAFRYDAPNVQQIAETAMQAVNNQRNQQLQKISAPQPHLTCANETGPQLALQPQPLAGAGFNSY
jgi:hypothetical protein